MKILKWFLGTLVTLLLLAVIGGYWFFNASKPVYEGEITVAGIEQDIEVYFDTFGIPHIYAGNEKDAYFALGYVHAQDRLFQMELLRRIGGGRLAEILGPDLIPVDRFMRTIGINEIAKLSAQTYLSSPSEPFQRAALSYLEGLNTFIKDGPTPPEFTIMGIPKEPFTKEDVYRMVGYMGFTFNTAIRTDPLMTRIATTLDPDYIHDLVLNSTQDHTVIPTYQQDSLTAGITQAVLSLLPLLPVPPWLGSNSWVVGPQKTRSGYPMLANDTHIGFAQPAVWYEAHLNAPGLNFYGNHLAGFPFGLVGHNQYCAWGLTIFPNDDMDFYLERPNPDQPDEVWNQDHWEPLKTRKEVIRVKGDDPVEFTVKLSRHGPVINEVNAAVDSLYDNPVSFFWTYAQFPNKSLQMAYQMAHSQSMDEFRAAVAQLEAPGLNVTYADVDGNIAWWAAARLLQRPAQVESKMILDGASGHDDPVGWFPFEQNPRSENPEWGFVYSANNQPDSAYGVFHPGYYYPGARGLRITQLLSQRDDWDLDGFKEMILDDTSPIYPGISQKIISLLTGELDETERQARALLEGWDGSHGLDATAPTIYYPLVYQLQQQIFADELGMEDFKVYATTMVARRTLTYLLESDSSRWWDNTATEAIETRAQIVNAAFRETIRKLRKQLGDDPGQWRWERMHTLEHQHAIGRKKPFNLLFNVGPFPITGGDEVINKMDFDDGAGHYKVRSGPAMRILIDLADIENSLSVLPTGQSGHPRSPHYRDQASLYHQGRFRDQLMDWDAIVNTSRRLILKKNGGSQP